MGVVYVVWGSTYLGIRFTIESMPPLVSGGARFLVAGAVLALVVFLGGLSAVLAGIAARKAATKGWTAATGNPPPASSRARTQCATVLSRR